MLRFKRWQGDRAEAVEFAVRYLICAGYTGRDRAAVERHIEEMRTIGVPPPRQVPTYYRLSAALVTTADRVQVLGGEGSGEVEAVLVSFSDGLWVGLGSDHTDRKVESYSIPVSKQLCFKPMAPELWPFAEVVDHWDRLMLRSHVVEGGERRLYQEGPLAHSLRPEALIEGLGGGDTLPPGHVMFGGTQEVHGGFRCGERFEMELEDPVLGRRIRHAYDIEVLPVVE